MSWAVVANWHMSVEYNTSIVCNATLYKKLVVNSMFRCPQIICAGMDATAYAYHAGTSSSGGWIIKLGTCLVWGPFVISIALKF